MKGSFDRVVVREFALAALCANSLLAGIPAWSEEMVDLVAVSDAAAESSLVVNRIVLTAESKSDDSETLQAFQVAGNEAVALLAEIEAKSEAGAALSETRPQFERAAQLILQAQQIMRGGKIEVSASDIAQLSESFRSLEAKYYPPPPIRAEITESAAPAGTP